MIDAAAVPSPAKHLLILARDREDLDLLPGSLGSCLPPVGAHATRRIGEVLTLLGRESFDAAICPVDRPRDVGSLFRLKKAAPRMPVLGLLPPRTPERAALSLEMGASALLERGAGSAATSALLHRALAAGDLARQTGDDRGTARRQAPEIRTLRARARALGADALLTGARHSAGGFEPLLVEDHASEAFLFRQALRKAGLPWRLPVARTVREAIAYLSGLGEFEDRVACPVPSIVILDFHLGARTGPAPHPGRPLHLDAPSVRPGADGRPRDQRPSRQACGLRRTPRGPGPHPRRLARVARRVGGSAAGGPSRVGVRKLPAAPPRGTPSRLFHNK